MRTVTFPGRKRESRFRSRSGCERDRVDQKTRRRRPAMSPDGFEAGRRRILTLHRWVKARKTTRVLRFVALAALPIVLAVAIKPTPLIFILYFLVRKDWRAALTSVATLAASPVPDRPGSRGFRRVLVPRRARPEPRRRPRVHDQPVVARCAAPVRPRQPAETVLWLLLSAIVVLLAVMIARRTRHDVVALVAIATAGLLVSPVSWSHHRVWCVPAFLALGFLWGNGTRVVLTALLVVFSIQPFTWLPSTGDKEMPWTWWQHIYGDACAWIAIGMLVTLAIATRDRTRVTADR